MGSAFGDVILVHDPDCSDSTDQFHRMFLTLLDPSGKPVGTPAQGCQFGRREPPATGSYTFKAAFKYRSEITHRRIPLRFVRPVRREQVSYGQTVSGNMEQRAAWDIYSWAGEASDLIAVEGAGCDLGIMLIVNADNASEPGPYHFVFQALSSPTEVLTFGAVRSTAKRSAHLSRSAAPCHPKQPIPLSSSSAGRMPDAVPGWKS